MDFSSLILTYVLVLLSGLGVVWVFYASKMKRFKPTSSHDRIFKCYKCKSLYTDDPDVDLSRCPKCGNHNFPYHF